MEKITHMFCSPMIRTIATALVGFDPVFDRGLKAFVWDDLREWGKSLCSTGTSLEILKEALEGENSPLSIVQFLQRNVWARRSNALEPNQRTYSIASKRH
jgi:hypothetical protein